MIGENPQDSNDDNDLKYFFDLFFIRVKNEIKAHYDSCLISSKVGVPKIHDLIWDLSGEITQLYSCDNTLLRLSSILT